MIISASRRSDIPCCYSEWFLNRLKEGFVMVPNPRNAGRLGRAQLSPELVDCIVFWTKNPAPMAEKLPLIDSMGYNYYFTFTVTAYGEELEQNLPESQKVVETFKRLSEKIGPERVDWRFDPILKNKAFTPERTVERFAGLCRQLHGQTSRCIISFVDEYMNRKNHGMTLDHNEMLETARLISEVAAQYRLPVYSCAEEIDLSQLGIGHASCIDRNKIEGILGQQITAKKDSGQRAACGCIESLDIGVYDTCANGCTYCYAVSSTKTPESRLREHDPLSPLMSGWPKGTELITDRTRPSQKIRQISMYDLVP